MTPPLLASIIVTKSLRARRAGLHRPFRREPIRIARELPVPLHDQVVQHLKAPLPVVLSVDASRTRDLNLSPLSVESRAANLGDVLQRLVRQPRLTLQRIQLHPQDHLAVHRVLPVAARFQHVCHLPRQDLFRPILLRRRKLRVVHLDELLVAHGGHVIAGVRRPEFLLVPHVVRLPLRHRARVGVDRRVRKISHVVQVTPRRVEIRVRVNLRQHPFVRTFLLAVEFLAQPPRFREVFGEGVVDARIRRGDVVDLDPRVRIIDGSGIIVAGCVAGVCLVLVADVRAGAHAARAQVERRSLVNPPRVDRRPRAEGARSAFASLGDVARPPVQCVYSRRFRAETVARERGRGGCV